MRHFTLLAQLKPVIMRVLDVVRLNRDEWIGRCLVWLAALSAGLVVVLYAKISEWAINLFFGMQRTYWWLPLVLTPLAGMLITWLTLRWFTGVNGSGIPQTMAALNKLHGEAMMHRLVSLKIAFAKIVLGTGALAAGFSAGREGPSVQVGASVMIAFKRYLPASFAIEPRHLLLAGGASGISAAFNTPLAGIVFAIEELGRSYEEKTNGVLITAIVLSGLVSISLLGNYTYFGNIEVGEIGASIVLPVIVTGFFCGVAGGVFSRVLIESSRFTPGRVDRFRKHNPVWWAGFCGLMVALLGAVSLGAAHGSGYAYTHQLLGDDIAGTWYYAPVKYLATLFTYLSGVPGGIFAPSLSIGAGFGYELNMLFQDPEIAIAVNALAMTAFLAAVTQAPLTSFIIVMEMINGHAMVISLIAVSFIARVVARLISPPLYATLAANYVSKPD